MSSHQERMLLPLGLEDVMVVCREAVASTGWRVTKAEKTRLSCKEVSVQSTSFTWPAEIMIDLSSNEKGTRIIMNGSIFGIGPIQSGHLKGQMGNLRNRIEIGLRKMIDSRKHSNATEQQNVTLISELERLVNLHKMGALTDEEFQIAKGKLLKP